MSYSLVGCGAHGCFGQEPAPDFDISDMPPPCDDEQRLKAMIEAALGRPVPDESASDEEKGEFLVAVLSWMDAQGLDAESTPQEMCDALIRSSNGHKIPNGDLVQDNGNGEGLSTGAKVAIGVGAVAVVGGIAYFALK
jgi:hypothetical protein